MKILPVWYLRLAIEQCLSLVGSASLDVNRLSHEGLETVQGITDDFPYFQGWSFSTLASEV